MIPAGARVLVAAKPVDFRKGSDSLMALVRESGADPFSGALYVFRSALATAGSQAEVRRAWLPTSEEALAVIRSMVARRSDEDIAASLNRMGMPTGQGKT